MSLLYLTVCLMPAAEPALSFYDNVRVNTLPNGLTVVLKPIPGAPLVTTMIAYKVGSGDEELSATGLSHYLEHLMFKGTDRLMPGDIDRTTLRNGGQNNAFTNEDLTVFYFDFAADRWETALDIEAERMRNLRIDDRHEFQQEKGAVIAELDGLEDNPFDLEHKSILPRLFGVMTPYGHPVIGEKAHVAAATANVIKQHYDRWYHPNNAVLVIAGGFDPTRAADLVKAKFGSIPAATLPDRKKAATPRRSAPDRFEFASKFDVPRMLMGFNTVAKGHADEPALRVLEIILSSGRTGRLYRALVEDARLASSANASHEPGRLPGWFAVQLELLPGKSPADVESLVLKQIKMLATEPVAAEELARARRKLLADNVFTHESVHSTAEELATGVALRGLDGVKQRLPQALAVTPADIQRVAREYLDAERRVTVWSTPKKGEAVPFAPAKQKKPARQTGQALVGGGYDLTQTKKIVLSNGLTLLLLENHRLPLVSAQAFVRGVRMSEPADQAGVATLTGSLLDEGSASRSGQAMAALIEGVGGELSMNPAGGSFRVLAADAPLGLELLFDCLRHPAFPPEAFARMKEQILAAIDDAETQPDTKAEQLFAAQVYGDHPLGRPALGHRATVTKLTAEDCRRFHAATFVPNRAVVAVVGDFNAAAIQQHVERLTADWKPGTIPLPKPPAPKMPDKTAETLVTVRGAAQLYVHLGHPGIRRSDPDYYRLLVMDYVLGTGSGFTDRLSSKLRDRMGLAYTVSATITSSAGDEPGTFHAFVGTFPDKFNLVKAGLLTEIRKLRSEPPTPQEVADVKQYLLGSLPFRYATSTQVAEQLLQLERFGLGFDYFNQFRQRIEAVTPADVLAAAKKHLDPDRLAIIAVGAIDANGRPVR